MHRIRVKSALIIKIKKSTALNETRSQSYGMSLAIWDHTVLPTMRHKCTCPALTPSRGLYAIYLPWMDWRLIQVLTRPGVSNSRPAGHLRPAKALFAALDTLSEMLKIWDKNKSFLFILQHFYFSKPAKLLFFSLAFNLAEPHAGAGSDQRWRQTVGLPPSFPLCVCLCLSLSGQSPVWALWLPRQAATTHLKKTTGNSTN